MSSAVSKVFVLNSISALLFNSSKYWLLLHSRNMEQTSSTKTMAPQPLGDLYKLPGEIRNMIYEERQPFLRPWTGKYAMLRTDSSTRNEKNGALRILRTCRQLNREVTPYLYEKEVLNFRVDSRPKYWLSVRKVGAIWADWWPGPKTRNSVYDIFFNLPYEKLFGIKVELCGPHDRIPSEDNEKLSQLLKNIRDFVRLLEPAHVLPPLQIEFRNDASSH